MLDTIAIDLLPRLCQPLLAVERNIMTYLSFNLASVYWTPQLLTFHLDSPHSQWDYKEFREAVKYLITDILLTIHSFYEPILVRDESRQRDGDPRDVE